MENFFRYLLLIFITMLFVLSGNSSSADTFTIDQKNHMFSEMYVKIQSKDVLKFINHDSVDHKLIFTHKGHDEHLQAIEPGKSQEVAFTQAGIYDIQCKHHPKMKLTIFIPHIVKLTKNLSNYKF